MSSLKLVIDKHGRVGGDCTSRDMCHFEDLEMPEQKKPATPKLSDVIAYVLAIKGEWGRIDVHETYDSKADALGECLAEFEYKHGELLNSRACFRKVGDRFVQSNIDELLEKEVQLISIVGGWSRCDYNLVLVAT